MAIKNRVILAMSKTCARTSGGASHPWMHANDSLLCLLLTAMYVTTSILSPMHAAVLRPPDLNRVVTHSPVHHTICITLFVSHCLIHLVEDE
jgi:hypothetical protein